MAVGGHAGETIQQTLTTREGQEPSTPQAVWGWVMLFFQYAVLTSALHVECLIIHVYC